MVSFFGGDNWRISHQRKVDPGIWHQVSLELVEVNIESSIKPQGGCDGRNNLANQAVQISVSGSLNVQVATANVVDSFVINHESTIGMIQSGMGS